MLEMVDDMASLKLSKLPDRKITKITFSASVQLSSLLEEYAALYEAAYGKRETAADLIPFMLEAFIKSDVSFRKARKEQKLKKASQMMRDDNL